LIYKHDKERQMPKQYQHKKPRLVIKKSPLASIPENEALSFLDSDSDREGKIWAARSNMSNVAFAIGSIVRTEEKLDKAGRNVFRHLVKAPQGPQNGF
jgi:hypothetical protein